MTIGNTELFLGKQKANDVFVLPLAFRFMRNMTVTFDNATIDFKALLSVEVWNRRIIIGKEKQRSNGLQKEK